MKGFIYSTLLCALLTHGAVSVPAMAAQNFAANSPEAIFVSGLTYARQKQFALAKTAFEKVIMMVPPQSEIAVRARNNLTYVGEQSMLQSDGMAKTQQMVQSSKKAQISGKDNYLANILSDGRVVHFSRQKMPLKVFLGDGQTIPGWDASDNSAVKEAMLSWQQATRGMVRFVMTPRQTDADIVIRWTKVFSDNILGATPHVSVGSHLVRSDIWLAVSMPDSPSVLIPQPLIASIATHELGHALGLKGHSPFPSDVMFPSTQFIPNQQPSNRDITTLSLLYGLDADVSNQANASPAMLRQYFILCMKGDAAIKQQQTAQAIGFYRQALHLNTGLPDARVNLGALLINQGVDAVRGQDIENARERFQEAVDVLSLVPQNADNSSVTQNNLAIAQRNLALVNSALNH
jgi:predicted Zn-dependent protease